MLCLDADRVEVVQCYIVDVLPYFKSDLRTAGDSMPSNLNKLNASAVCHTSEDFHAPFLSEMARIKQAGEGKQKEDALG
nr:unnamed protein product [Haemonchus contortus]